MQLAQPIDAQPFVFAVSVSFKAHFTRVTLYSLLRHLVTAVRVCRYCFLPGGLHENDFVLAAKINAVPAEDLMRKPKAKPAEASAAAAPSV